MRFLILLFLVSCAGEFEVRLVIMTDCTEVTDKLATFIVECTAAATAEGSDEDPEDWVLQCEETGNRIYCDRVKGFYRIVRHSHFNGLDMTGTLPCLEARLPDERAICRFEEKLP